MATLTNRGGEVFIGVNQVASIESFEYSQSLNLIEQPDLADGHIPRAAGRQDFEATAVCKFDQADTNGQEACTNGASVNLILYPGGDVTGQPRITCQCLVDSVGVSVSNDDGYIMRELHFVNELAAGPTIDTVP